MTLTKDDIRLAAESLHRAEKARQQIRQLSLELPGITIVDAHAIQQAWIEIKPSEGRAIKGNKIANKIAALGLALEPGQVVLAGSFIRPIETRKGDTIPADHGPHGSVSCYFA